MNKLAEENTQSLSFLEELTKILRNKFTFQGAQPFQGS